MSGIDAQTAWLANWTLLGVDVFLKATVLLLIAIGLDGLLSLCKRTLERIAMWNAFLVAFLLLPPAAVAMAGSTMPISHVLRIPENIAPLSDGIILVYGVGFLAMTIRLVVGLAEVRSLRRSSPTTAGPPWIEPCVRWRCHLDLKRPVAITESRRVSVPTVTDGLRPIVFVPEITADSASKADRNAILLHELLHVRRRDLFWQTLACLVQVAYWPHPLVHLMLRRLDSVRERACDAFCVHHLPDPLQYRSTLVSTVEKLARRPMASLGLAMARSTRIATRLEQIDRGEHLQEYMAHWPTRLAIAIPVYFTTGWLATVHLVAA